MSKAYVVIHVATTCDEHGVYVTKDSAEVIELAWIILNSETLEKINQGQVLVRPVNTPITALCTSLTTLTWDQVCNAGAFRDAVAKVDHVVQEFLISKGIEFTFVVYNSWDLRVQLPREARDKAVILPPYLQHARVFDLRTEYYRWQAYHPESLTYSSSSLPNICAALEVEPVQSSAGPIKHNLPFHLQSLAPATPRRAMEEVITLSRILFSLIKKSQPLDQHPNVLTRPLDARADVRAFLAERSKVLHLSKLPHDTTQSELESWFTHYGGRPIAFWTLRTPDQHKPTGTGFAVFSSHEEAAESLAMNGRAINERAIEVSPSSSRVLDHAQDILTPFPLSKNRPRPGDWTCPACGFSNFQRRTACFRCGYPASSSSTPGQDSSFSQDYRNRQPSISGSSTSENVTGNPTTNIAANVLTNNASNTMNTGIGNHNISSNTSQSNNNNTHNIINSTHGTNGSGALSYQSNNSTIINSNNHNNNGSNVHGHNNSSLGNSNINGSLNSNTNNTAINDSNNSNSHHNNNGSGNPTVNSNHSINNNQSGPRHNGGVVPFRAGDWRCGNEGCSYHNFAKNICCLKCGASRGIAAVISDGTSSHYNPNTNSINNNSNYSVNVNNINGNISFENSHAKDDNPAGFDSSSINDGISYPIPHSSHSGLHYQQQQRGLLSSHHSHDSSYLNRQLQQLQSYSSHQQQQVQSSEQQQRSQHIQVSKEHQQNQLQQSYQVLPSQRQQPLQQHLPPSENQHQHQSHHPNHHSQQSYRSQQNQQITSQQQYQYQQPQSNHIQHQHQHQVLPSKQHLRHEQESYQTTQQVHPQPLNQQSELQHQFQQQQYILQQLQQPALDHTKLQSQSPVHGIIPNSPRGVSPNPSLTSGFGTNSNNNSEISTSSQIQLHNNGYPSGGPSNSAFLNNNNGYSGKANPLSQSQQHYHHQSQKSRRRQPPSSGPKFQNFMPGPVNNNNKNNNNNPRSNNATSNTYAGTASNDSDYSLLSSSMENFSLSNGATAPQLAATKVSSSESK